MISLVSDFLGKGQSQK